MIDCGELVALSVMVMAAVRAPVTVGAKCPWMMQLAPAARLVPQLFANMNDGAFVPVTPMLLIVSVAVLALVIVTDCDALDVPTFKDPKGRLAADSDGGEMPPVPLSLIDCGELLALSVMVMAAVSAPVTVGAKCP